MVISIYIPIFKQKAIFLIEPTKRELKRHKVPDDMHEANGNDAATFNHGVVLFYKTKDKIKKGIISHEILHLVCYLCKFVGIKFSDDSEEVYAYTIDYITEEFYAKFDKL